MSKGADTRMKGKRMAKRGNRGFTLIELLVVVAIISLLVSILLPSLAMARAQAKAVKCAANVKNIGVAMVFYVNSYGVYPASYVYPYNDKGEWNPKQQPADRKFGYMHWSHFLYSMGQVNNEAFECPALGNGGCPRTNPGPLADDWEPNQVDNFGDAAPCNVHIDKQAPRMAYTCNAAIVPRNKFTEELSGFKRTNRFVRDAEIDQPGTTILATEFHQNWKSAAVVSDSHTSSFLSKSHRPISAFWHISAGSNEYSAPMSWTAGQPGFVYGNPSKKNYGLVSTDELEKNWFGAIDGQINETELNAVGRHHPGGEGEFRGTANYLFCDGHAGRMGLLDTMERKMWGDKYYSLTGPNGIQGRTVDE